MVLIYNICGRLGLSCPLAKPNGECEIPIKECIKDDNDIDELDLFDMLDEEEE